MRRSRFRKLASLHHPETRLNLPNLGLSQLSMEPPRPSARRQRPACHRAGVRGCAHRKHRDFVIAEIMTYETKIVKEDAMMRTCDMSAQSISQGSGRRRIECRHRSVRRSALSLRCLALEYGRKLLEVFRTWTLGLIADKFVNHTRPNGLQKIYSIMSHIRCAPSIPSAP